MKRAWIWLLSAALLLGGCGSQDGYTDQNEEGGSTDGQESMGRYLEEDMSLPEGGDQARYYHSDVVPAMEALRAPVDALEMIVDKEAWPMPSYGDLIFEV